MSALVARYLGSIATEEAEFLRLEAQQREVAAQISEFRAGDRLDRDELHSRALR
ncbi:MAG: hypothetical protein ACYCXW_24470 [Solirubrobacteraceae bacterium]